MSKHGNHMHHFQKPAQRQIQVKVSATMLDKMVDGREFESLLGWQFQGLDLVGELRKGMAEIEKIRNRPCVCYVSNVVRQVNASVSIDDSDNLPFNEMIATIPIEIKKIDVILVTPGGSGQQVAKFVNTLRPRFEEVGFILLDKAMSAGTIFIMSGDEIIMNDLSHFGPIDPQVRNRNGEFVPAQSLQTLISEIQSRGDAAIKKGQNPPWADLQILRSIDPKEIGASINASQYSIQLVEEYLHNFKFKTWVKHSSTNAEVTVDEKRTRANEIASLLCNHGKWKHHGHAITRNVAWDVCKLEITHSDSIDNMTRAMRRLWALLYWSFENTTFAKVFLSKNYCIIRQEIITGKV